MRSAVAGAACLVWLAVGVVGDLIAPEPITFADPESAAAPCTEQGENSEPLLGGPFVPQCDRTGQYEPLQCHGSTGYCWCVDTAGDRISRQVGPSDNETITRDDCVALRLEETVPPTVATPTEDGDTVDDENNDGKLGLVFVLAFASLVVLPVVLWFVLRRACAKPDETGHRTSLVEDSDKGEQGDISDEEDSGSGRARGDAAKSETTPLSRSSGS